MADKLGCVNDDVVFRAPPATVKRRKSFLAGRLELAGIATMQERRERDAVKHKQPDEYRPRRSPDRQRQEVRRGKIAATPRPLSLRKRKALLAKMVRAAGLRQPFALFAQS